MTNATETEKALLGYLLYKPDELAVVKPIIVDLNYFTAYAHKLIYATMLDLEPDRVDDTIVAEKLRRQGTLQKCGGRAYLAELVEAAPGRCNPVYYAMMLREEFIVREMAKEADKLQKLATTPPQDSTLSVYDMLGQGISSLQSLQASLGARQNKVSTAAEVLPQVLRGMELALKGEIKPAMSTGLESLDAYIGGGLYKSEMNIFAGRPSVGKTSVAMAISENLSPDKKVVFISLETTAKSLVRDRLLPSMSRVTSSNIRMPNRLDPAQWDDIYDAGNKIAEYKNLKFCDPPSMTIADIESFVRQEMEAKDGGIGLFVVDYMQLIRGVGKYGSREERVADISQRLKALIKEFSLRSLILAQLNREVQKQNREPRISDLRESGQIEQDADGIFLLHEEKEDIENNRLKIIIAKNRNGKKHEVVVRFNRKITRIDDGGEYDF
jgi:replicative DNA helicase